MHRDDETPASSSVIPRDNVERRRLLAYAKRDALAEDIREHFERLARGCVLIGVAAGITFAASVAQSSWWPTTLADYRAAALIVSFAMSLTVVTWWFNRSSNFEAFKVMSRRFGYPIVLLAGFIAGSVYGEYAYRLGPEVADLRLRALQCEQLATCRSLVEFLSR